MFERLHDFVEWCHARKEVFFDSAILYKEMTKRGADPIFDSGVPADVSIQAYLVDYNNRKHIFAYNPTNTAIVLTDTTGEWTVSLPSYGWTNISFPQATRLKALTGTNVVIKIKCTDELIP